MPHTPIPEDEIRARWEAIRAEARVAWIAAKAEVSHLPPGSLERHLAARAHLRRIRSLQCAGEPVLAMSYNSGQSMRNVAKAHDTTERAVRLEVVRLGVPIRSVGKIRKYSQETLDKCRELHLSGMSYCSISRYLQMPVTSVKSCADFALLQRIKSNAR